MRNILRVSSLFLSMAVPIPLSLSLSLFHTHTLSLSLSLSPCRRLARALNPAKDNVGLEHKSLARALGLCNGVVVLGPRAGRSLLGGGGGGDCCERWHR